MSLFHSLFPSIASCLIFIKFAPISCFNLKGFTPLAIISSISRRVLVTVRGGFFSFISNTISPWSPNLVTADLPSSFVKAIMICWDSLLPLNALLHPPPGISFICLAVSIVPFQPCKPDALAPWSLSILDCPFVSPFRTASRYSSLYPASKS